MDDPVFRYSLRIMLIILIIGLFIAFSGAVGNNTIQTIIDTIYLSFFIFVGINVVFDSEKVLI